MRGLARLGLRARAAPARRPRCRRSSDHLGDLAGSLAPYDTGVAGGRRPAHLRGGRELEGDRGELPRVLPLPADPPGAVPGDAAGLRRQLRPARRLGRRLDGACATAWRRCRWTASWRRRRCPGSTRPRWSTSTCCPNLLVSAHPDYVMTHRMVPLAPGPDLGRVLVATLPDGRRRTRPDPAYAVEFWDITNRQDWAACESVQRGLSSPALPPRAVRAQGGRGRPARLD